LNIAGQQWYWSHLRTCSAHIICLFLVQGRK